MAEQTPPSASELPRGLLSPDHTYLTPAIRKHRLDLAERLEVGPSPIYDQLRMEEEATPRPAARAEENGAATAEPARLIKRDSELYDRLYLPEHEYLEVRDADEADEVSSPTTPPTPPKRRSVVVLEDTDTQEVQLRKKKGSGRGFGAALKRFSKTGSFWRDSAEDKSGDAAEPAAAAAPMDETVRRPQPQEQAYDDDAWDYRHHQLSSTTMLLDDEQVRQCVPATVVSDLRTSQFSLQQGDEVLVLNALRYRPVLDRHGRVSFVPENCLKHERTGAARALSAQTAVQQLCQRAYHHGGISRDEAERRLRASPACCPGLFLTRCKNELEDIYVLSVVAAAVKGDAGVAVAAAPLQDRQHKENARQGAPAGGAPQLLIEHYLLQRHFMDGPYMVNNKSLNGMKCYTLDDVVAALGDPKVHGTHLPTLLRAPCAPPPPTTQDWSDFQSKLRRGSNFGARIRKLFSRGGSSNNGGSAAAIAASVAASSGSSHTMSASTWAPTINLDAIETDV